jgi:hypothetical protein
MSAVFGRTQEMCFTSRIKMEPCILRSGYHHKVL